MKKLNERSPMHASKQHRGFTLIELMIVVAIVAILVAVAYPSYQDSVRKSRRGQAKADLVELAQRAERFHTVNNTYAGFWATVPTGDRVSPRTGSGNAPSYNLARADADTSANSFKLTAAPTAATDQVNDRCGTLALEHTGAKRHSKGEDGQCQFGVTGT